MSAFLEKNCSSQEKKQRVCVKPLRSMLEVFQKSNPLTTVKSCRCFAVIVNFLSLFFPELQLLLELIYDLTGKGK